MGVILAVLAALEGLLERLRLVLGRLEGILDRLGGILGRLGGVLGPLGSLVRWHGRGTVVAPSWHRRGTGVEAQRPPIRILYDFPAIIRRIIRNERKDMRKEIRIRILLGYHDSYTPCRGTRPGAADIYPKRRRAASPPPRLYRKQ